MFGVTSKIFQANYQNWWLSHWSCWCRRSDDQIVGINTCNCGFGDQNAKTNSQNSGFGDQNSFYRHHTASRMVALTCFVVSTTMHRLLKGIGKLAHNRFPKNHVGLKLELQRVGHSLSNYLV